VLTPDDLMDGRIPRGRVIVFDDDHFYLGGVLAELIARAGQTVTLVTTEAEVSVLTHTTMEQARIHRRLLELGVEILPHRVAAAIHPSGEVRIDHVVTGEQVGRQADALVLVTARVPRDHVATQLLERQSEWPTAGIAEVVTIGDAHVPATIAAAVWGGRRFAEELDGRDEQASLLRDVPQITATAGNLSEADRAVTGPSRPPRGRETR
jgi:dimethylamine/trimethylamine dehydrogenase